MYVSFDIETAKVLPPEADIHDHRPVGICCASYCAEGAIPRVWFGRDEAGNHAPAMSRSELIDVLVRLETAVREGKTIVTWNGLGFDFDILAEETGEVDRCATLARNHVDMMFFVVCEKGYPLSLAAASQGMGLTGKLSGVEGSDVPAMWQRGEYEKVVSYAAQDAKVTLELANACAKRKSLRWTSRAGNPQYIKLPSWPTVEQALQIPEPDTSWMDNPMTRDKFTGWMK